MWHEELDEAECDETMKSNIRVLDCILNGSQLGSVSLAHRIEFNEIDPKFKQIGEERNVLHSLLRYVLEVKDIGRKSKFF